MSEDEAPARRGANQSVQSPRSPQTLTVDERRTVAQWAAECAESVLPVFESEVDGDKRVRQAIDQAYAFAAGNLDVREAISSRGAQAGAAARGASSTAATAAAYAAEQAAAVAHMAAHALGAAGYAGKAAVLDPVAGVRSPEYIVEDQARRYVELMNAEAIRAITALPLLEENSAGPLAPGRLSKGHVGATIRAVQNLLEAR